MNVERELTESLDLLFRGIASRAAEIASLHGDSPFAKCLLFLAYDFFFLEPNRAEAVFGGADGLQAVMAPDRVEGCFLEGYRALFCREHDVALRQFTVGLRIAPVEPFMFFGVAVAHLRKGNAKAAAAAMVKLEQIEPQHPLVGLFRKMLRYDSDY